MGRLKLPKAGLIYIDAQIPIYCTDNHPTYKALCAPIWQASGVVLVVSSELTLMETLVVPMREGNNLIARARMALWDQEHTRLLPITKEILVEAARLRATIPGLKTPDAIHAATALHHHCSLFVTNDSGFRRVPGLPLAILDDVLAAG